MPERQRDRETKSETAEARARWLQWEVGLKETAPRANKCLQLAAKWPTFDELQMKGSSWRQVFAEASGHQSATHTLTGSYTNAGK